MTTLAQRHQAFEALHQQGCFLLPNPWDAGTAKLMAASGAQALATTSAGFAFTIGKPDMGRVTRDEMLAHAQNIVAATDLPVSGDLENGFGDTPDDVALTVRGAAEVGLSGCTIEDTIMTDGNPAYPFELAIERVAAGVAAARQLSRPFMFCARADGIMNGSYDTDEAIRRLQAFEAAGADVLYAPIPPSMDELARIVKSVSKPVNGLAAGPFTQFDVADFARIGVRRVSIGSAMARVIHKHTYEIAQAMCGSGDLSGLRNTVSSSVIDPLLDR